MRGTLSWAPASGFALCGLAAQSWFLPELCIGVARLWAVPLWIRRNDIDCGLVSTLNSLIPRQEVHVLIL